MVGSDNSDAAGRNANARDRLENLKARRAAGTGAPALIAGAQAQRAKGKGGAGKGAKAEGKTGGGMGARIQALLKGSEGAERRQSLMRVVRILTDTPDDGTGIVTGTPFSVAGVKKLVNTLEARSKDKTASGAGMATQVMVLLAKADAEGGGETVHGVQVKRLVQLAKLGEKLKVRVAKGAKGASD